MDEEPVITLSAAGTVAEAAELFRLVGQPFVFDPALGGMPVDVDADELPISQALRQVAMALGPGNLVARLPSGGWYVGAPREDDRSTVILRVPGAEAGDWLAAYALASTDGAEVASVGDTVIIKDVPLGLERVAALHDAVSSARKQYMVDVTLVEASERAARDLGIDWTLSGATSLALGLDGSSELASINLSAALSAARSSGEASLVVSQRLLVVEGGTASMQIGDTVPIPQRTISPEGVISTTGYDEVETGVLLDISARSVSGGGVLLDIRPEVSAVSGFVEEAPIIARRTFESSAVVQPGGVVVLGGLAEATADRNRSGIPGVSLFDRRTQNRSGRRLFVFVRPLDASHSRPLSLKSND